MTNKFNVSYIWSYFIVFKKDITCMKKMTTAKILWYTGIESFKRLIILAIINVCHLLKKESRNSSTSCSRFIHRLSSHWISQFFEDSFLSFLAWLPSMLRRCLLLGILLTVYGVTVKRLYFGQTLPLQTPSLRRKEEKKVDIETSSVRKNRTLSTLELYTIRIWGKKERKKEL